MRRTALALTLVLLSSAALAQQVNDIQLRQGSSSLWGATFNANNNQVIDQFNTAGSVVDSFRWFQGTSAAQGTFLWSVSPTGHVAGAATGGRQGAGTINAKGFFVDGVAVGGGGGTPGGTPGQVQYNNAGAFGGFTTSGDATINTASGALTLATVNGNVGTWGSATLCSAFTVNAKGLITGAANSACTPAIANVTGLGTGIAAALAINTGSAGAPVLFNGAGGTPSSLVGTNITGTAAGLTAGTASAVAVSGITGAGAGCITFLTTPSSANLRGCLTDESGTGVAYFQGGALGTPSSATLTNATGLPNAGLVNSATTVAGVTCTLGSTCGFTTLSNSLAADVLLNNTANYFTGPTTAQGTTGTWFASGTVTISSSGADAITCKLWDGTAASVASTTTSVSGGGAKHNATLSGVIVSPAGNIRISCRDSTSVNGIINFAAGTDSKDSTLTVMRIN